MNDLPEAEGLENGPTAVRSRDRAVRNLLIAILILLGVGFLYVARDILLPISIACLFALVLGPVVRWLYRRGVPPPVSAAVFVVFLLFAFTGIAYLLAGPVSAIVADAPRISAEIQEKFSVLRRPMEAIGRATAQIEAIVSPGDGTGERVVVEDAGGLAIGYLAADAGQRLAAIGLSLVLLLFILASGDLFQEKLIRVLPTLSDKKRALKIARDIEREVSRYMFTMSFINLGVAVVTGLAMWAIGMPSPILWGVANGLANFLPYVGPAIVAIGSFGIGLVAFDTLGQAIVPPLVLLVIGTIEGQFVTPTIVGQRHSLNAIVILLSIAFWGWIWGIVGALIAVPLLVTAKVFADYVDGFRPFGEFLSARPTSEEAAEEAGKG